EDPSPTLQEMEVTVMDARMCNNSRFWNGKIGLTMICFQGRHRGSTAARVRIWGSKGYKALPTPSPGHSPVTPPPQGDSGSPLVCGKRPAVAGVVSFGKPDDPGPFKPPVATSTVKHKKWIQKTLR
ncbi:GRAM protein, partial [Pteruthius melanotis]|nr:GRAM protein [Pteruthius melanotis]